MAVIDTLEIGFKVSLSDFKTGLEQLKSELSDLVDFAKKATSSFSDFADAADFSDLQNGLTKTTEGLSEISNSSESAMSALNEISRTAQQTTNTFREMTGVADLGRTVTNVDVAEAKLTLLERKAAEAREKLQTLRNAADAGQSVTGIEEAQANLTLLEAKVQAAKEDLMQLQLQGDETSAALARDFAEDSEAASRFESSMSGTRTSFLGHIKGMVGGLLDFGSKIGMTIFGLQQFGQIAVSVAQDLFQPAMSAEQMTQAFTTLLGSTQAATNELKELDTFAAKTPFKTLDIDQAASQLIGFGVNVRDVIPDLTAMGDALSAVGRGSSANLDSVVNIFGKIQTQGKLTGETMQELADNGINAWSILEKQTGKSRDALQSMISSGLYPADQAMRDLTTGIEANSLYAGGMAKQSTTLTGILSTLKSNFDQVLAAFGAPILKGVEPLFANLASTLSSQGFKDFASSVGQGIVNALTQIGSIGQSVVVPAFKDIAQVLNDEPLGMFLVNIQDLAQSLGGILVPALQLAGMILASLSGNIDHVKTPASGLADVLYTLSFVLSSVVVPILNQFGNFLRQMVPILTPVITGVSRLFATLAGVFNQVLPPILKITQQIFDGLRDVMAKISPVLAGQLIPALIRLATTLGPIIAGIATFIEKSRVIPVLFKIIGDVLAGYFSMIAFEINAVVAVIQFFVSAISLIVGAVQGTVDGSKAVWSNFTGWFQGTTKSITQFFRDRWSEISSFFGSIGKDITDKARKVPDDIRNAFTAKLTDLKNDIKRIFTDITNFFGETGKKLQSIWQSATDGIVRAFKWLYDHNYYFKDLVDFIRTNVSIVTGWLVQTWDSVTKQIASSWSWVVGQARTIWTNVSNAVKTGFQASIGAVVWVWGQISTFFSLAWQNWIVKPLTQLWTNVSTFFANAWTNWIANPLTGLWKNVSTFFSNAWNNWVVSPLQGFGRNLQNFFSTAWSTYVSGPVNTIGNNIKGVFDGLKNQASQWGKNLINSFVDGIKSAAKTVGDTVSNVAGTINNYLGFHSPAKEGPGRELMEWPKNMMKSYAAVMEQNIPLIQAAAAKVAAPLALNLSASGTYPTQGRNNVATTIAAVQAANLSSNQTIQVRSPIYIGERQIGEAVSNWQKREIRAQAGVRR